MAVSLQFIKPETEEILRAYFTQKGWEFSRPVLFPASRSNLVVMKDGEKIDVFAIFQSESNLWTWNVYYPPMTESSVLVSVENETPEIYVVPTQALLALGEENARRWELQDPSERSRETNQGRRVWRDQISDWLL